DSPTALNRVSAGHNERPDEESSPVGIEHTISTSPIDHGTTPRTDDDHVGLRSAAVLVMCPAKIKIAARKLIVTCRHEEGVRGGCRVRLLDGRTERAEMSAGVTAAVQQIGVRAGLPSS